MLRAFLLVAILVTIMTLGLTASAPIPIDTGITNAGSDIKAVTVTKPPAAITANTISHGDETVTATPEVVTSPVGKGSSYQLQWGSFVAVAGSATSANFALEGVIGTFRFTAPTTARPIAPPVENIEPARAASEPSDIFCRTLDTGDR